LSFHLREPGKNINRSHGENEENTRSNH
jgi:hypothetical protein